MTRKALRVDFVLRRLCYVSGFMTEVESALSMHRSGRGRS
jgi:hypothetical protein